MLDLFFIKTFVAITKTGSFQTAAARNHITQPAVSQHVQILEKRLDTKLFERNGKKATLTPAGKTFLPYAESILKQYEEAKMRVQEANNEFRGTIRIATIYSIGLYELQSTIKKFFKKYTEINLHLEYHQNAAIYEMILNRTVDFGLVAFPRKRTGIVSEIFVEDDLVFVQSPLRRAVAKRRVSLKDLDGVKFIAFSPATPTGKVISQFLAAKNSGLNVAHEYDNIELVKSAVILGLGCAVLPKNTIARELKERSLEVLHTDGFNLKRPLGILYPERKIFTKTARTFYEALMERRPGQREPALRV